MKVVKVCVGKPAESVDIDASLGSLQETVGGFIEMWFPFMEHVVIVCNEEGKVLGLPKNRIVRDEYDNTIDCIYGDFVIVGVNQDDEIEDDLCDLSEKEIEKFVAIFNRKESYADKE